MWWLVVVVGALGAEVLRRLRRVRVTGSSMEPTYRDGEYLVAWRVGKRHRITHRWIGRVVIVRQPDNDDRWLVKRLVAIEDGDLEVRGDNPATSTDSRNFGAVPRERLGWVAIHSRRAPV